MNKMDKFLVFYLSFASFLLGVAVIDGKVEGLVYFVCWLVAVYLLISNREDE